MAERMISLAAGVMPDATPQQTALAAAAAGFDAVGIWIDTALWSDQTTREVSTIVKDQGLKVLDAEPAWLRPGAAPAELFRLLDIAADIGAANVLVVSSDPDVDANTEKFIRLCEHARGMPLRLSLEFGAFSDIPCLDDALGILYRANQPNQALLVDPLHLQRTGGTAKDLKKVPSSWFNYAQFCDSPFNGPSASDRSAIREEALDGRLCPGEGELPLADLLQALPAKLPLSVEVRSKRMRSDYPDFAERACVLARHTRQWLVTHD